MTIIIASQQTMIDINVKKKIGIDVRTMEI
jgi:hypothetical protein